MPLSTASLPAITPPPAPIGSDLASAGAPIPAIDRLRLMGPQDWETFIFEWAYSLKTQYPDVERCSGAGDMGRDIIAFPIVGQTNIWDNFQCKHYDHRLQPADLWLELAKVCYYSFINEYTFPREYYFVAPRGAGTSASKLLRNPLQLKEELLNLWDDKCANKITSTKQVQLEPDLRRYIEAADFTRFHALSPLQVIEEHRATPWHALRFGGGLPARPAIPEPPEAIGPNEANYIRALLDAYAERVNCRIASALDLQDAELKKHFRRSRLEFYCAEALREFSKDVVPPGTFDALLDEVYSGIADVIEASHLDGYERLLAAVKQAKLLPLISNPLTTRVATPDKGGMCHQLANEQRVRWRS